LKASNPSDPHTAPYDDILIPIRPRHTRTDAPALAAAALPSALFICGYRTWAKQAAKTGNQHKTTILTGK